MASKLHVPDNSVAERRLRPIYDWLDLGNNKKALQECDKVLKKTPTLLCAKALKALALLRLGKETECTALLDALLLEKPCDDATLQAMTLCYRDLQQPEGICRMYETAVKLDPTNEELHTHLFMSYVRLADFKSQQQAAMTLYKLKSRNPYYCWAVMSVILQATRGEGRDDPKKRFLLLSLAERMMLKLMAENKLEAEQEVQLYLMILEYLRKFEEILNVVDGPLGVKLATINPTHFKLPYFVQLERWADANLACKSILVNSVDKWDVWKLYINTVFQLMAQQPQINNHTDNQGSGECNDLEVADDTPEKAHEFICRLVENGSENGYHLRGPYLARFELCTRLVERGDSDPTDLLGDTTELFVEYFRKFGHKPCCVPDLRSYLPLLTPEKLTELSSRLIKHVGIGDTSVPRTEQQMQRHICGLQLSRLCGGHRKLSPEHLRAVVEALSLHYEHGFRSFGGGVLGTELGPADAYAVLGAHVLYDLAQVTGTQEPVVQAIVLLEGLLRNSPSNFHAKLLGVRLYHTLGGGLGAQAMYDSLDIKHLQLDSLGYIHCARLPTTGLFKEAANLYDVTLKFFASNYKDSSDHLTFSHKFGSFTKLNEFMDFREKLNNSIHYTTTAVDRIVLGIVQCVSLDALYALDLAPRDTPIDWDELRDNHDLSVYLSWDPERILGPPELSAEIADYFRQNVHLLRLRAFLVDAVSTAVDIARCDEGKRSQKAEALEKVLDEWADEYRKAIDANYVPIRQNQVTLPLPSRLHRHLQSSYYEIVGALLRSTVAVCKEDVAETERIVRDVERECERQLTAVRKSTRDAPTFWEVRDATEHLVNVCEVFSVSVLLCLLNADVSRPVGKKGKRRVESGAREALSGVLRRAVCDLDGVLSEWRVSGGDVEGEMDALSLDDVEARKSVWDNLENSHACAVREMQSVLRSKSKLLNGLLT